MSDPRRTVRLVLEAFEVVARPGYSVSVVRCADDHTGWSAAEVPAGHRVVLVRRGRFRRRVRGVIADADPTAAYLAGPGDEECFAHPAGGDVCTSVEFGAPLWRRLAGDRAGPSTVYVDAALELAHRRVVASAADPDYALAEQLLALVGGAITQAARAPTPASPGRGDDRAVVARAREAIVADAPAAAGLFPLAEALGVSPYRLSRAFPRELGVSLTRYRNRVRVGRALERLEAGERELAVLAADLGFADQAHLTRTVREHAGVPPGAVRRLLAR
ncbi:AraC family transcriptional regulator [Amycolatopsis mediterranei S699]|uniref:AraC family transcriptional regulator n=3 Tax=Amycolatopsis mediterranei TaxID=33910 RepID=A0A0H3D7R1_AMYMU|nr:helix-turn-helix transcriptional regulator [Amycolatopsis mediterranei]ADJ46327.1 AraC family transcriptional regulator [Amycolatopsis mediterranei U32]AEK43121.1 AraC family transcriptional regulator [Amycolatopsis mediterranei S699]AFO78038.1 AraC family transcriptional regulator [Amycolatopsis mediterranei S699]AGT85166.1 AraC family transcriptional regulator [Amycolatopsis mediterranei RB]KDO06219.1 AraC family transcriptional regulator [Amycolatopsis mediterranei]